MRKKKPSTIKELKNKSEKMKAKNVTPPPVGYEPSELERLISFGQAAIDYVNTFLRELLFGNKK